MVEITPTIQDDYPNAFAKAETERPWITRCGDNQWRVVPRTLKNGSREHGKYVVRFVQWGKRIFGDCVNVLTGDVCDGYGYTGFCYHLASAIKHCQKVESRKAA